MKRDVESEIDSASGHDSQVETIIEKSDFATDMAKLIKQEKLYQESDQKLDLADCLLQQAFLFEKNIDRQNAKLTCEVALKIYKDEDDQYGVKCVGM